MCFLFKITFSSMEVMYSPVSPLHHRVKKKVLLVFDGVDTVSSISLNGIVIGKTDNMFRKYVCVIKKGSQSAFLTLMSVSRL